MTPRDLAATIEALREQLVLPAHQYRVVRMLADSVDHDSGGCLFTIAAYTDEKETGTPLGSIHILDVFLDLSRDMAAMNAAVNALNEYIVASRRVLGLDTDVFARNGIG